MGSMSVSSCRCSMFVSCMHLVAVLNAAFCIACSLLMLVEAARGDHYETDIIVTHYIKRILMRSTYSTI